MMPANLVKPPHRAFAVWCLSEECDFRDISAIASTSYASARDHQHETGHPTAVVAARLFYDPDKVIGDTEEGDTF
jgi:hypothetical protein